MKIVIAGLGRSGTTALFFKIKNSLPKDTKCLFEPREYLPSAGNNNRIVLAKILIYKPYQTCYESFNHFDKKILIVRDPKDRLISSLLYEAWNSFYNDEKKVSKLITLLKKKESEPHAVSVSDILRLIKKFKRHNFWKSLKLSKIKKKTEKTNLWLSDLYGEYFNLSIDFHSRHRDYYVIKYEDFIVGRVKGLENYLGFRLLAKSTVDKEYERVVRSKSSGDWKNWFLEKDIKFFKPFFSRFMQEYGYSDNWEVSKKPEILPEHCSEYVRRIVGERKKIG